MNVYINTLNFLCKQNRSVKFSCISKGLSIKRSILTLDSPPVPIFEINSCE